LPFVKGKSDVPPIGAIRQIRSVGAPSARICRGVLDALHTYAGAVVLVTHDPGAAEAADA
jgi:hypothetical protein